MKTKLLFLMGALFLSVCSLPGLQMRPLSIQQLTDRAQMVLHGNVARKSVQRDLEGRIYTRIELDVTETWKGRSNAPSFVIVQSGGVLGEEAVLVEGQEDFAISEEVVVFLVLNQRGEGLVIGLVQGKFKVTRDSDGEKIVHNPFHGTVAGQKKSASIAGTSRTSRLSLSELRTRVQGGRP
jgi:hypothetical protein